MYFVAGNCMNARSEYQRMLGHSRSKQHPNILISVFFIRFGAHGSFPNNSLIHPSFPFPTGFFISSLTFTYPHSIFFPQPSRFFLTISFISFPHTVFFLFKSSLFSTQFVSYFLAFFPSLSFFFYSFRILSLFHFDLFYHSLLFSRLILISTEFSLIRQKPNVTNWDRKIVLQQSLKWGGDV